MSDEQPPASSPFAPAPSARPPSADEIRVQVRVPAPPSYPIGTPFPAPGGAMPSTTVPVSPLAPTLPTAVQTPMSAPAAEPAPLTAAPHGGPRPPPRRALVLGAVAGGALLVGAAALVLLARGSRSAVDGAVTTASASASSITASAVPSASASADVPKEPAPAAPSASQAQPALAPFDEAAARAALDAQRAPLAACKIPKTKPCRVSVTFAPDGKVTAAKPLAPYAGTPKGKCVAAALKKARVAPFEGAAAPLVYVLPPK